MRMRISRRRGFFGAHALFWMLLCTLVAGIAVERITHVIVSWRDTSPDAVQRARAEVALEAAEDWLCVSFGSGDTVCARNVYETNPLLKIEAVRIDGSRFELDAALVSRDVEVFIADASFDVALFSPEIPPYAIPSIPHDLPTPANGNRGRYRYFVRSRAGTDERNYRTVCEELLEIEHDATFGTVVDVRRVFFRRRSEPR